MITNLEKKTTQDLMDILGDSFIFKHEVYGNLQSPYNHKPRRFFLDTVATHKETGLHIGFENKHGDRKRGKDVGKHLVQAGYYSQIEWRGFGKMPIVLFPSISFNTFIESNEVQHGSPCHTNINSVIFKMVQSGELMHLTNGWNHSFWAIVFNHKYLWRSDQPTFSEGIYRDLQTQISNKQQAHRELRNHR